MSAKILVVDDDKSSVETTVEALEREGYDLYAAAGGREIRTAGGEVGGP